MAATASRPRLRRAGAAARHAGSCSPRGGAAGDWLRRAGAAGGFRGGARSCHGGGEERSGDARGHPAVCGQRGGGGLRQPYGERGGHGQRPAAAQGTGGTGERLRGAAPGGFAGGFAIVAAGLSLPRPSGLRWRPPQAGPRRRAAVPGPAPRCPAPGRPRAWRRGLGQAPRRPRGRPAARPQRPRRATGAGSGWRGPPQGGSRLLPSPPSRSQRRVCRRREAGSRRHMRGGGGIWGFFFFRGGFGRVT